MELPVQVFKVLVGDEKGEGSGEGSGDESSEGAEGESGLDRNAKFPSIVLVDGRVDYCCRVVDWGRAGLDISWWTEYISGDLGQWS